MLATDYFNCGCKFFINMRDTLIEQSPLLEQSWSRSILNQYVSEGQFEYE